ncbi:MAG: hypothetical protein HQK53_19720, partial [Oligoflexia bacterium]|nr:hypothetical protein [Oligoflexia bacterium]
MRISFITPSQFISTRRPLQGIFHLYGGGYLNKNWSETYIKVLLGAKKFGLKIISTGVQADEESTQKCKDIGIKFLSVRDSLTRAYFGTDAPLCDDSFGYFA